MRLTDGNTEYHNPKSANLSTMVRNLNQTSIKICEERKMKRQQMMPQKMRKTFLQHLEEDHRNQTHILYTDGSKTENGSAYAAVTEGKVVAKERLPKESSILTAELYAMKWVEEKGMHGGRWCIPFSQTQRVH